MPEQYFDPAGLTEPHTTPYTLTVYHPPRPPPRWLPSLFLRPPVVHSNNTTTGTTDTKRTDTNPSLDCFELKHLPSLPTKSITVRSSWFLPEMRCEHLQTGATACDRGCYFYEKGGAEVAGWKCGRRDCEGHVYCGPVRRDGEGRACFGEKGRRMVCVCR